jgi:hypothetical protein
MYALHPLPRTRGTLSERPYVKKVYYEKVGRRYKPVGEYDSDFLDSFPKGNHLVMCHPGGSSRKFNIDPNYAAMIAAGRVAEDAISKHLMDVSALRVPEEQKPLTEEQRAAWEAFNKAMGNERFALEWCSYREAAQAGVTAMMTEAEHLLQHPVARKAFERFVVVCQLTKEHKV